MANENSATGSRTAAERDRSYGGGYNSSGRSIGSDRPDRNRLNLDTVTPRYGWGDMSASDFSILGGGIKGLFDTITGGNTYSGRTPLGFDGKPSRDNGGKGLDQLLTFLRSGMYQGGLTGQRHLAAPPPPGPMAAPAPAPVPVGPMMTMGSQNLSVGGGLPYGVTIPSYKYQGPLA